MIAITKAYIDSLLADASYVDVTSSMDADALTVALGERMTPTLAAYIAANFEVASSINTSDIPLLGSGFDATVWRGKTGGDYAGQVFVSMRGTEPPPVAAGADLLAAVSYQRLAEEYGVKFQDQTRNEYITTSGDHRYKTYLLKIKGGSCALGIAHFRLTLDGDSAAGYLAMVEYRNSTNPVGYIHFSRN